MEPSLLSVRPQSPPKQLEKKYKPKVKEQDGDYLKPTAAVALKAVKGDVNSKEAKRVLQEDQEKKEKELTFKPKVNVAIGEEVKRENRFEKLAEPMSKKLSKLEKLREKSVKEKMEKECPFKPTLISKQPKDQSIKSEGLGARFTREAKRRADTLERARQDVEASELKECTFKPNIVATAKAGAVRPIYERFQEVQKRRNEKLEKLREEANLNNPELKFHPTINEKGSVYGTVIERLCKDAEMRTKKIYQKSELLLQKDYTFEPAINQGIEIEQGFFARQTALNEKKQAHIARGLDDPKCTFQPEVNPVSEMLISGDPKRVSESTEERINRLHKPDRSKELVVRRKVEQENREKYTYHPNISKKSKEMAYLKKDNEEYETKKRKEKERIEEAQRKEYTFHPQITPSPGVQAHYANPKNILSTIKEMEREKEAKLKQIKMNEEHNKVKECTFRPQVEKPKQLKEYTIIAGTDSLTPRTGPAPRTAGAQEEAGPGKTCPRKPGVQPFPEVRPADGRGKTAIHHSAALCSERGKGDGVESC
eukprot:TRINITY_DN9492_c0_g3_i1.p1 TRINITY_DN9492_c0_g3~~TRINITY_DN9492_c0_g3_i1.p1  ORF type:complete len:538 (-),score=149.73 TRINITY_DN9492_c0_g3_i1:225-1838(-)